MIFIIAENCPLKKTKIQTAKRQKTTQNSLFFDWKYDAVYVIGDFRRYYNLNILRVENMHWWEFISLFWALPDDSVCQKRIAYRNVDISQIRSDSERKRILRIKQAIALPFELGDEDICTVFGGV